METQNKTYWILIRTRDDEQIGSPVRVDGKENLPAALSALADALGVPALAMTKHTGGLWLQESVGEYRATVVITRQAGPDWGVVAQRISTAMAAARGGHTDQARAQTPPRQKAGRR